MAADTNDKASLFHKNYSKGEELANAVTHGLGVGLSIAALSILVTFAALYGDAIRVVSFSVYGTSLILLYLASTFYHAFRKPKLKQLFRLLDHSAIFILIAGTYTPFTLVAMDGAWGWSIFGIIWGLAIAGIIITLKFMDKLKRLCVILYLAMGWMVIVAIKPMIDSLSLEGLLWLGGGGLFYSLGVIVYIQKKIPYTHAIWHLFVLGGSVCHFFGILFHVLPMKDAVG